jgi:hypothetical protein
LLESQEAHAAAFEPLGFETDKPVGDWSVGRAKRPSGSGSQIERKDCRRRWANERSEVVLHSVVRLNGVTRYYLLLIAV